MCQKKSSGKIHTKLLAVVTQIWEWKRKGKNMEEFLLSSIAFCIFRILNNEHVLSRLLK